MLDKFILVLKEMISIYKDNNERIFEECDYYHYKDTAIFYILSNNVIVFKSFRKHECGTFGENYSIMIDMDHCLLLSNSPLFLDPDHIPEDPLEFTLTYNKIDLDYFIKNKTLDPYSDILKIREKYDNRK